MTRERISELAVHYILTREIVELRNLDDKEIARHIGITPSALSQCFKKDHGITLRDFILREKIYRAIFRLEKDYDISINELSEKLGFLKVEDFVKRFKAFIAVEPGKYRDLRKVAAGMRRVPPAALPGAELL